MYSLVEILVSQRKLTFETGKTLDDSFESEEGFACFWHMFGCQFGRLEVHFFSYLLD